MPNNKEKTKKEARESHEQTQKNPAENHHSR